MYLSLIFGSGLIILINGKYLLVDVDVHKNAVLPTKENNSILARCDFPPCYPPPRKEHKQRMDCIPCLTCPGICTRSLEARAIKQKFNNTEGKKVLPMPQNDRFNSTSKVSVN